MTEIDIVVRVLVAFALTFTLGFEREIRGSSAGDRTFSLIGVGTSVIGVLSAQGAPTIMTGAVTGVGFIGAGLLFRQADANVATVHGVTTAASILAAAAIGAVAGEGQLLLACIATALVLTSLEIRYIPGLRLLDARRWADNFKSDTDPHHGAPPQGFVVTAAPPASHEPPNARSHALGGHGVHLGIVGGGDHGGAAPAATAHPTPAAPAHSGLLVAGTGVLPGAPDPARMAEEARIGTAERAAEEARGGEPARRVPGPRIEPVAIAGPYAAAQLAAVQTAVDESEPAEELTAGDAAAPGE